jgi:hypothetical protein
VFEFMSEREENSNMGMLSLMVVETAGGGGDSRGSSSICIGMGSLK